MQVIVDLATKVLSHFSPGANNWFSLLEFHLSYKEKEEPIIILKRHVQHTSNSIKTSLENSNPLRLKSMTKLLFSFDKKISTSLICCIDYSSIMLNKNNILKNSRD